MIHFVCGFLRTCLCLGALMAALSCISTSFAADIFYVNGSLITNGNGSSWSQAFNNLKDAIDEAQEDDQIWVRTGTYKPGTSPTDSFELKNKVKIFGGFAGTESPSQFVLRDPVANPTILSGDLGSEGNAYHVVKAVGRLEFPHTVLDGFTIRDGHAPEKSGQIDGAGIYIQCTEFGTTDACRPIIARCTFVNNSAYYQGGAAVAIGDLGSTNQKLCEPYFVNCSFLGNSAWLGGGVAVLSANVTFMNCVFSGNSAGIGGAVVGSGLGSIVCVNGSFSTNSASQQAGGIGWSGGSFGVVNIEAVNTILWGNTDTNPSTSKEEEQIAPGATVNFCCIEGWTGAMGGTGNIDADPRFINSGAGNLRLHIDSPCIDTGSNSYVLRDTADLNHNNDFYERTPYDIASRPRFASNAYGSTPDPCAWRVNIGAHESGDCDGDGISDDDDVDVNGDGIPDDCQGCAGHPFISQEHLEANDCNNNGRLDACDIELECSSDLNQNGIPDECECGMEIVFVIDTSGSMEGDFDAICDMVFAIEQNLPSSPLVKIVTVNLPGGATNLTCLMGDVEDIIPDPNAYTVIGCPTPIGDEDWVSAIQVLAGHYTGWNSALFKVIIPISNESNNGGDGCLASNCTATHPAIEAAIIAAYGIECTVHPIVGTNPDQCTPEAAAAIADGTGGFRWLVSSTLPIEERYQVIGVELAALLMAQIEACLDPDPDPHSCPADLNGDSQVNGADLGILLGDWGPCSDCAADLNGDGQVNGADLGILLGDWGNCPGSSSMMSGGFGGSMTPEELAEALNFESVAELAEYLASLDFEMMEEILAVFLGS